MSRRARRWIVVAVVAILVVGTIAAIVAILGARVAVPAVTGLTEAEAGKALEDAGLKAGEIAEAGDAEVAAGLVLRQDPAAGTEVDEGSSVSLTLSTGPGAVVVPDVVDMTRAAAEGAVADAGLVPASVTQYDLTAPPGEVVGQLPAGGEQAAPGSQVGLIVSRGRPEVEIGVPDVAGMSQDEATAALADAGLVTVPVEAYDAEVPVGDVAGQEPAAGERVAPLSEVLITVSLGEGVTTVKVPDVAGLAEAKATDELTAAGLTVTAAHAWSADVKEGLVIAQAPAAGVAVEEGGDAGILVSLGPALSPTESPSPSPSGTAEPPASPSASPPEEGPDLPGEPPELTATVPDVVGMDAAQAEEELTLLGLRPVPLEAPSETAPAGVVVAQLPQPGKQVPKSYPVLLLVSTGASAQVEPLPAEQ